MYVNRKIHQPLNRIRRDNLLFLSFCAVSFMRTVLFYNFSLVFASLLSHLVLCVFSRMVCSFGCLFFCFLFSIICSVVYRICLLFFGHNIICCYGCALVQLLHRCFTPLTLIIYLIFFIVFQYSFSCESNVLTVSHHQVMCAFVLVFLFRSLHTFA